jgi:drug/metabolite transporter (DMT)-like permease
VTGAFLTALFFAGNAVCARRAALHYGGTTGNFLRLLLAVALLGAWAHAAGQGAGGGAFAWFFLSGAVGFGLGGLTMFHALPLIGSNLSMLIVQCGSAVAAALTEWLWLGTRLSAGQAGFAGLVLVGVIVALIGPMGPMRSMSPIRPSATPPRLYSLGIALAIVSACAQGGGAAISRKAFAVLKAHSFFMDAATSAYQRALGGLAIGAIALLVALWWPAKQRATPSNSVPATSAGLEPWVWVVLNTLLGPVIGVTCYQWALRNNPAGIVLPIVATAPLLTVPISRAIEGGWPARRYWIGAVLAVAGAAGLAVSK